jgi:hypothetical protein
VGAGVVVGGSVVVVVVGRAAVEEDDPLLHAGVSAVDVARAHSNSRLRLRDLTHADAT